MAKGLNKICIQCSKEFQVTAKDKGLKKSKFCSTRCNLRYKYDQNKKAGICVNCRKVPALEGHTQCHRCKTKVDILTRVRYYKRKDKPFPQDLVDLINKFETNVKDKDEYDGSLEDYKHEYNVINDPEQTANELRDTIKRLKLGWTAII